MKVGVFATQLIAVTVVGALGLLGFEQWSIFQGEVGLGWWSLVFFVFLTLVIYWKGSDAAVHDRPQVFTSFTLMVTLFKMILAVAVVLVYKKTMNPDSSHFLGPFFFIYFLFTAFETIFLTKIGKQRKYHKQNASQQADE